jgi:branched-chain amino acid transport system substrate-binding protein
MAVESQQGRVLGRPIEVLIGDHQSKPDIGVAIARQWFDADNVTMVIGFDNSSVALAVEKLAAQVYAVQAHRDQAIKGLLPK